MFKPNKKGLLIKTPTGFSSFVGIQKKLVNTLFTITFDDNSFIKCSGNHALLSDSGFITANQLTLNNTVTGKRIVHIDHVIGNFEVFDPVGIEDHASYYSNGVVSHNTEFLGSSNTLISGDKLRAMVFKRPIREEDHALIYEVPAPKNTYALIVDVSEGQGQDYSAFSIFDVSQIPYRQVARYRNNRISPMLFPTTILSWAKRYNEAFILVEINSIGLQVADILHNDFAYENLIKIQAGGKKGQEVSSGYNARIQYGIRTTAQTKRIGCANLKTLIESDKLIINDDETIEELKTFSASKQSFAAEEGNNDDLVMTLVHFAWLASQRYFKESVGSDIRKNLQEEQMHLMDQDLVPFGVIDDGLQDPFEVDDQGDRWIEDRRRAFPLDDLYPFGRL